MKIFIISFALVSCLTKAARADYPFRPIPDSEQTSRLLEGNREVTSLLEMEQLNLNQGETSIDLWSGHYWPHFQGSLGIRYRDPLFIHLIEEKEQFQKFKELFDKRPNHFYSNRENFLSPAEKYDLLVGDQNMTLTKSSWQLGEKSAVFGKVPTWRGICDGWSAASQKMPRPRKAVTLTTLRGTNITFYPEDIKALGSLLYARNQDNVIFLGKRCYSSIGSLDHSCDGTNPGAFHKALANRVGLLKKSFNADVSITSEVWNYPVKSYRFTYFNVLTKQESDDFRKVYEVFEKKHRFVKHMRRHEKTSRIVGVKAEVYFTDMRPANLLTTDDSENDQLLKKTYYYDLELDRSMRILGGEWYSSSMPDFIWAPDDVAYPLDESEKTYTPQTPLEILRAAQIASKDNRPLAVIVEKLFELSK